MLHRCLLSFRFAGRTIVTAACLTFAGLVIAGSPAGAQGPATLKAIGEYRLTMPTLRKLIAAGKAVNAAPDAAAINAALGRPAMSIEDVTGTIDRYPAAKQAVSASGLSAKEFATAYLAYFHTVRHLADAEMRKAQGQTVGPPAHVRPDNVQLIKDNQAELARLSDSR
jgi:NAD(P)-dependent dehydrogenase (short-subunit alcohol dehydrogenase family)